MKCGVLGKNVPSSPVSLVGFRTLFMAEFGVSERMAGNTAHNSHDPYDVLRNRDFVLYLVGRFVAAFGQQMLTVAVGWEIFDLTHDALSLAIVGLTQMVPMVVFTLPAGYVADNFNRKRVVIVMTFVIACASAGLALIPVRPGVLPWIYLCLAIGGIARTFLWPASAAFLPQLVTREQFPKAVTWNSGAFQLACVTGRAAGGGWIALTGAATQVYAANAGACVVFLLLMSFVRRDHVVAVKERLTLANLVAGFEFVFASPIILGTITLDMFAVLLGGATALLPIYASRDILDAGPTGLGFLHAALPLGAVMCAFWLAHRGPLQKAGPALLWSVVGFGLATVGFGFSKWFGLSFLLLFICGAVDNISVVVRHTLVQLLTPDEKRGRVSAVNSLFIGTSNELGEFESGLVAYLFGPKIGNTVATGAIISVVSGGIGTILVVAAVAWIWPQIRKYGRLGGS
jgi:MFS family permease